MTIRVLPRVPEAELSDRIRVLTPGDIDRLRLGWWTKSNAAELRAMLQDYPGRSVWLPETLEFAAGAPWRHRRELVNIAELSAVRHPEALIEALVERSRGYETAAVLLVETNETRPESFYRATGFELLDAVYTFELPRVDVSLPHTGRLQFRRLDVQNTGDLTLLLAIDGETFPWIWQNSPREFFEYSDSGGVELFACSLGDLPVAYLGVTAYLGWGHIDRVAVLPEFQGQGLGRDAVAFAIERLRASGAIRIGLSTQRDNLRSQRLYERFGFRRASSHDYRLYGRVLKLPPGVSSLTT